MPFELTHKLVSRELAPRKQAEGEFEFFTVSLEGSFEVLFPGRLIRGLSASFNHRFKPPVSPGEPVPVQGGSQTDKKLIVLKLRIFSPDGSNSPEPRSPRPICESTAICAAGPPAAGHSSSTERAIRSSSTRSQASSTPRAHWILR
jgi:hypothetical protein